MLFVGLILGITYSRLVQQSVYNYFDGLTQLPVGLAWLGKIASWVSIGANEVLSFYRSSVAILLLGVVPALIVIGCVLLKFVIEAQLEEKRSAA